MSTPIPGTDSKFWPRAAMAPCDSSASLGGDTGSLLIFSDMVDWGDSGALGGRLAELASERCDMVLRGQSAGKYEILIPIYIIRK